MKITGAEITVRSLIDHGVKNVFGYPGGSVLHIYDELYKFAGRINHVITAHEQGAAHAADGYARATGETGVVIATSGPGATNLVTGIANAYLDSVPMVAITGNVATPLLGKDSFQEVDIVGITMPVTKHNYIVRDIEDLAEIIDEAFFIAKSGRPGPVLIDIPKDVQAETAEYAPIAHGRPGAVPPTISESDINKAARMISEAQKPYIYCGGGVVISEAGRELLKFAERIDAPIGCSIMGLSAVPHSSARKLGMTGMHGRYASTKAKSEADLIIAAGVRFSDRATGNKNRYTQKAKILHIDIDPAEIDKNIPTQLALCGDVKTVLGRLTSRLTPQSHPDWRKEVDCYRKDESTFLKPSGGFTAREIIGAVSRRTNPQTVVATDVGQHQMWSAQFYPVENTRTFLTSGGLGTMGFGLGAAIGGCIGSGGQRTVLFTGDGSFGMNLNELATAVSQNLPLVIVIFNNGVLGMVRQWQTAFYGGRYSQSVLARKTDFVKLAQAFGASGFRAADAQELETALNFAFEADGVTVIDCLIFEDERVLPMIPPGGSIDDIIVE
ncbi:MAG: biosynthetic-type acetolactate synthase large subunit [Oscillospiraceae bacterium]|nr:biosynthetic-type acetolactate synthase large subunit [Oscillospiraceae bacterium]